MGRGVWRGARRTCDDDTRRYQHGHASRKFLQGDGRRQRTYRPLTEEMTKEEVRQCILNVGIVHVVRAAT